MAGGCPPEWQVAKQRGWFQSLAAADTGETLPARQGLESWVWRKGPWCQRREREDSTWKMVTNAKYKVMQEETRSCSSETPAWVCPAQQSALGTELSPQQHNLGATPHVLAAGCIPSLLWRVLLQTSEWHRVEGCCRHSLLNLLSSTIIIFFFCVISLNTSGAGNKKLSAFPQRGSQIQITGNL